MPHLSQPHLSWAFRTCNHQPSTLHPTPYILHLRPQTPNPKHRIVICAEHCTGTASCAESVISISFTGLPGPGLRSLSRSASTTPNPNPNSRATSPEARTPTPNPNPEPQPRIPDRKLRTPTPETRSLECERWNVLWALKVFIFWESPERGGLSHAMWDAFKSGVYVYEAGLSRTAFAAAPHSGTSTPRI
jgi:hypothetical protein